MIEPSPGAAAGGLPALLFVDARQDRVSDFVQAFGEDFSILTAGNIADAESILAVHGKQIGVLVSDQKIGLESGVALLSLAKARYPHIVRILTAEHPDSERMVAAINDEEVYRYVAKPWNREWLRDELHGAMELHNLRHREQELIASKRTTVATLAAHIAHEMATPLTTIRLLASSMEESWPALLDAYRRDLSSDQSSDDRPSIPEVTLETMATAPTTMRALAERTHMLMQLMLVNAREDATDGSDFRPFSLRACIKDALDTYAFGEGEADFVRVQGEDFQVRGSDILMTFVIYNLLKNALHALRVARRGKIRIRLQPGSSFNTLIFRDTGTGIPSDALPRVFEEFYTATGDRSGTGMGLPFCRRVMHAFGGRIDCWSHAGECTQLLLRFPLAEAEKESP